MLMTTSTNLQSVTYPGAYNQQYGYEALGNRQTFKDGTTNYASTHNNLNQLTQTTNTGNGTTYGTYAYDLDGNTSSITRAGVTWTQTWNAENRMNRAVSGTQTIDYLYYDEGY